MKQIIDDLPVKLGGFPHLCGCLRDGICIYIYTYWDSIGIQYLIYHVPMENNGCKAYTSIDSGYYMLLLVIRGETSVNQVSASLRVDLNLDHHPILECCKWWEYDLVGGVPTPLKNISQLELLFPLYGKIKNVPNHQPVIISHSNMLWIIIIQTYDLPITANHVSEPTHHGSIWKPKLTHR